MAVRDRADAIALVDRLMAVFSPTAAGDTWRMVRTMEKRGGDQSEVEAFLLEAGLTTLETARRIDPGPYGLWTEPERLAFQVDRLISS